MVDPALPHRADPRAPYAIRPAAIFDVLLPLYDVGCSFLGLGRSFKRALVAQGDVRAGQRVLDVACGTGVLAGEIKRLGARVVAVDPDPRAVAIASRRVERVVLARGEALPFADRSFHRVFCTLALHHVPDDWKDAMLVEVRRVLAKDGVFLLADFDNHGRRWVPRGFRSETALGDWLARAGFVATPLGRRRLVHVFRCVSAARS